MSDTIPISQLPTMILNQATNSDLIPIVNKTDLITYNVSLQNLDVFIKTSPSSSKSITGTIQTAINATSSLTSSYLNYTGIDNGTSSYSVYGLSSSYSVTSSNSNTSSYSSIADFARNVNPTLLPTASLTYTSSFLNYNGQPNGTASYAISSLSSSYSISASYAINTSIIPFISNVSSSLTTSFANYANKAGSSSYAKSYNNYIINNVYTSSIISSSYALTASSANYSLNINNQIGRPEIYGAVGDGVTDDWVAIKNCILSHSIVEFDAKTYAIRGMLPLPSNTTLIGQGIDITILKIIDNSPYGYSSGPLQIFSQHLLPDNVIWITGSTGLHPIGTDCKSGSVNISFGQIAGTINPNNGRWTYGTGDDWLDLQQPSYVIAGGRQNVFVKGMTLDGNFNNQARHTSFNWVGNPDSASYGGSKYYLPEHSYKIRSNVAVGFLTGQNLIFERVKMKGIGAGVIWGDDAYTPTYNENFALILGAPAYASGLGNNDLKNFTSFRDSTSFNTPFTGQTSLKPNHARHCIAESFGNPDYQNPFSNQTVFGIGGRQTGGSDGNGNYRITVVDLLSSLYNCTLDTPYPRVPSTGSVWNGNILSEYVSSSYTYTNLLGSYDGTVSGYGYLTGSIGMWAMTGNGPYKKIDDGSAYGRWEPRRGPFEYQVLGVVAPVTKNNYIRGTGDLWGNDSYSNSLIAENNTLIDIYGSLFSSYPTTIYGVGYNGASYDKIIIRNNYIQLLDFAPLDWNNATSFLDINFTSRGTATIFGENSGEIVIQNNTIRIPVASSRYNQEYFQSITASIGVNAPWELQNFNGNINGTIVGTGSGTPYSGSYNQTFTNFNGLAYTGSVTGSVFFNKLYNNFQRSIYKSGFEYQSGSNPRNFGIGITLDKASLPKSINIEGNAFINFNIPKYKGPSYLRFDNDFINDRLQNSGYYNNEPICFYPSYGGYPITSSNNPGLFSVNDFVSILSNYNIENNYDNYGNLVPITWKDYQSAYYYNFPNYSKNNLFLERNSILTPDISLSKNILSRFKFTVVDSPAIWQLGPGSSTTPTLQLSTGNPPLTSSVTQLSSSFMNQLQPNKTYVFEYVFKFNFVPAPGPAGVEVKIGTNKLFNWDNSIHNVNLFNRVFFTTTGNLSNPIGDFSITAYDPVHTYVGFNSIKIYEYYPTASVDFNIKNTIINLDDNLNIFGFLNTGSYITGTYVDVDNNIGNNIPPRNDEVNLRLVQTTSSFYNVTWPNNINWDRNPNVIASSSVVNYKFRYDKGQIYGTHDLDSWLSSGSNINFSMGKVGIGTNNPQQSLHVVGNISCSGFITPTSSSLVPKLTGSIYFSGSKLWMYTGASNSYGGWVTSSLNF